MMRKSFKDALKALEADIQLANTLYLIYSLLSLSLFHFILVSFGKEFLKSL